MFPVCTDRFLCDSYVQHHILPLGGAKALGVAAQTGLTRDDGNQTFKIKPIILKLLKQTSFFFSVGV